MLLVQRVLLHQLKNRACQRQRRHLKNTKNVTHVYKAKINEKMISYLAKEQKYNTEDYKKYNKKDY